MAAKLSQMPMWQGKYPVLDTTDISGARPHEDDLEMRAAINELHHKMPRHEAEKKAYDDYRREQIVATAAHHYTGMKASAAAGKLEDAKKHGVMYLLALKHLGHNDPVRPPEAVMERVKNTPSDEIGRFKPHKADVFTVPQEPDEEPKRGGNEKQVKEGSLKKSETVTVEHGAGHKLGMVVTKGGTMCKNCSFVSEDGKNCSNEVFQKFNGSSTLPAPDDEYCCDEWHPKGGGPDRSES